LFIQFNGAEERQLKHLTHNIDSGSGNQGGKNEKTFSSKSYLFFVF